MASKSLEMSLCGVPLEPWINARLQYRVGRGPERCTVIRWVIFHHGHFPVDQR